MTAKKLEQIIPQTSVLVRRVVRRGSTFICGLCRVEHPSAPKAQSCLSLCWRIIKRGPPFILLKKLGKFEYACIFCMRSYETPASAKSCASECSTRLKLVPSPDHKKRRRAVPVEEIKSSQEPELASESPHPSDYDSTPTTLTTGLGEFDLQDETLAPNTVEQELPDLPVEDDPLAEEPIAASKTKKARVKRDMTKKFERHGSKYVCEGCNAKFFTKEEVEACFDKHE